MLCPAAVVVLLAINYATVDGHTFTCKGAQQTITAGTNPPTRAEKIMSDSIKKQIHRSIRTNVLTATSHPRPLLH